MASLSSPGSEDDISVRPAGKAGTWYIGNPTRLGQQLYGFLLDVPDAIEGQHLPVPGARIVIAPHAGYTYSGYTAAWAYKALDLTKAKRVFILGPSHTYHLRGCAVTTFERYATPFGDLEVDRDTTQRVKEAADMDGMEIEGDLREHSLEMHLPYLYRRLEQTFGSPDNFPPIVPILVGNNDRGEEKTIGRALAPWMKDEENAFIISSDFCHWGSGFQYTPYSETLQLDNLRSLNPRRSGPDGPPIHETIKVLDKTAMDAVESGSHDAFYDNLKKTGNTVCGRHPIGVTMAGLEILRRDAGDQSKGQFHLLHYDRSALVERPSESSVSYVAMYAVP